MNPILHTRKYYVIIPVSLFFILIALLLACLILGLILSVKRLHTVTHLLVCNGAIASIYYCLIQCVNYSFLAFLPQETSDLACRWRGFFGYMAVVGIVYSYLAQAISRLFISVLSMKYRWANAIRTHLTVILIQWLIVLCLPLPAILTKDISYRPFSLCWVPEDYPLHLAYTIIAYYLTPALGIFTIYIYIYLRIKRQKHRIFSLTKRHRDLDVLYNIMILFAIYIFGALPIIIYIVTRNEVFYVIGLISVSLGVAVEKLVTFILDRDMRNILRNYYRRTTNRVRPQTQH